MCKYCERPRKNILEKNYTEDRCIGFGENKCIVHYENTMTVFIRNNNILAMGDEDDCQCIDAVSHIKINFCPMCGIELGESE